MNTLVALVAAVAAVILVTSPSGADASTDFRTCAGFDNSHLMNPFHISVRPDPLVAKKGKIVDIHADLDLVAQLPVGAKVDLHIKKEGLFGITIPCISVAGVPVKIGSCHYEAQQLLNLVPAATAEKFFPAGQTNQLPLRAGHYGSAQDAIITLPEIPGGLIGHLIHGKFDVEIKISNAQNHPILCISDVITIT